MRVGPSQEVRYQVFISSTFLDLQDAREEAIQAILELDCFPAGMELFPAANDEKWDLIKAVIDDSDYYILIVGGRYGSVDEEGISFTEKEYDYAVETGTPVLAFLHADPDGLPKRDTEADGEGSARLDQFREKVSLRMCKYWSTPAELGSVVSRSLIKTMKNSPAKGWVRADQAMTSDQIVEMEQLRRQVAEFEKERFEEGSHVPDGIDEFAQGADETELTYGFKATGSGFIADEYVSADEFTWDGIFSYLGPAMFDEASETSLRSLVNKMLEEQTIERNQKEIDGGNSTAELWGFLIDNASFDKVKVQLVALGLMSKSVKRHGVNDKNTYWSLTPYGEQYVMRLKAERRE